MIIVILVVVVLLIGAWYFLTYNNLIKVSERVNNSKGQIAAQIESRWDALSSIIPAVKKFSAHESETFEKIVKGRSKVFQNSSVGDMEKSEIEYQEALSRLFAVAENYPELKSSNLYQDAMKSIEKYEDNVRYSRMTFNDTVTIYNSKIKSIPTNIVANSMNLRPEKYFENSTEKSNMPSWD